jgi:hypothetical protein
VLYVTYTSAISSAIDVAVLKNRKSESDVGSNNSANQSDREAKNPKNSPISVMC